MEVPRVAVDELKTMIDKGEAVTILDVRQPEAYTSSSKKIKGAQYLDPGNEAAIREFAKSWDKSRTVVAYCA